MGELFSRYGTEAEAIAAFIVAAPDAPYRRRPYSEREILFLIRNEAVEHLDDVLLRRTTRPAAAIVITGCMCRSDISSAWEIRVPTG